MDPYTIPLKTSVHILNVIDVPPFAAYDRDFCLEEAAAFILSLDEAGILASLNIEAGTSLV